MNYHSFKKNTNSTEILNNYKNIRSKAEKEFSNIQYIKKNYIDSIEYPGFLFLHPDILILYEGNICPIILQNINEKI